HGPGVIGAQRCRHHDDLHACTEGAGVSEGEEPAELLTVRCPTASVGTQTYARLGLTWLKRRCRARKGPKIPCIPRSEKMKEGMCESQGSFGIGPGGFLGHVCTIAGKDSQCGHNPPESCCITLLEVHCG